MTLLKKGGVYIKKIILYFNDLMERRLYIYPPRNQLLIFLSILVLVLYILIIASVNLFLYATIPIFLCWNYYFLYFLKLWKSFCFSRLLVIIIIALTVAIGVFTAENVRMFIMNILFK